MNQRNPAKSLNLHCAGQGEDMPQIVEHLWLSPTRDWHIANSLHGYAPRDKITQAGVAGKWKLYEKYGKPGNALANLSAISLGGWS
jgi:hypothetical protein